MSIFVQFNRKSIDDRQIDTLIGLSHGLLADGKIDGLEAQFLFEWLIRSRQSTDHPIIVNLLSKVSSMLSDGILDDEETQELLSVLRQITGEPSEFGEIAKSASLPFCEPAPTVTFQGRTFLFTGTCAYGTRKQCQDVTEKLSGVCAKGVSKTLNYLVLGTYVTDSWIHETFGRKIEKAMQYRNDGAPIAIISETHWANAGGIR